MNGVMKILNTSKNTIYIEELDLYLPFTNEPQELETDFLKRSKSLRNAIIQGILEVVEYNPNERIEASVVYLHKNHSPKKEEHTEPEEIQEELQEIILNSTTNGIEVKFHGIFFDGGGYAKVNRNLVQKLSEAGIKIKIDPKHCQNELTEKELAPIKKLMQTSLSKNHISIDSVIPSFGEFSSSKYPILYTTVESYTIPKQFIECCQYYREIWCTSPFAKRILEQYVKDKPIYVIPAGSDPELYCEYGPKFDFKPNIKNFVFLSVFGWSYRKGYDVLLRAYFEEFNASEDVSLLIASRYQNGTSRFHKEKIKEDINKIVKEFPNKDIPHVVRYSQMIPEYQMPQLYRSAHCFVLPSRGESSCLCSPEASLCGLPVIMTNVSGQQMYLREDNAFLVEMDYLEEIKQGQMHLHYWDNQKFPALKERKVVEQLKQHMRYVFNNLEKAKDKNKNLQKLIKQNYTWTHTANAAIERLKEIKAKNL